VEVVGILVQTGRFAVLEHVRAQQLKSSVVAVVLTFQRILTTAENVEHPVSPMKPVSQENVPQLVQVQHLIIAVARV
tara:strand:+ start:2306 stop:2536 length:231 start_codon:yes stop_codon:yes gene_type:complete